MKTTELKKLVKEVKTVLLKDYGIKTGKNKDCRLTSDNLLDRVTKYNDELEKNANKDSIEENATECLRCYKIASLIASALKTEQEENENEQSK